MPPPQSQAPPSAEEEALKRNTDCVYFLASPLTCKKGSKCEYRHSDMARLNPRDCWYWLNGNCLNPKCAFRHPPLDGFMEGQIPTIRGSSVAPVVSVASTPQVPYAASKQGVPCIFFQQGLCIKGDKCAFTHAPNFFSYKAPQPPNSTASSEIPTAKKAFGGVEKSLQGKKLSQTNNLMPRELPKPVGKLENYPTKNDNTLGENVLLPNSVINREYPMYKATSMPMYKPTSMPSTNGNSRSGPRRVQQPNGIDDHISMQNKDDEISREPSPGFDVLVDDELRGSDYYHGEDQYGGMRGNGGRNEYDMGDSADYDSVADIDRDMYCDGRGYDSYDRLQGSYAWEQLVASSDRMPRGSAHLESRPCYDTEDTPEQAKISDLRHQLSKHRRGNSLKSVISHAFASERHVEDRANSSRRDTRYLPPHDSSLCGRLRGRIKLPVRSSSPADRAELRSDRQMERVRDRGRLSSERPQLSSYQGRLRDRIKRRVREDFNNGGRNNRGPRLRRDIINDNSFGFSRKTAESNEQNLNEQHLGKRKFQKLDNGEDISFEGPMPLQEILKRKRGGGTGVTSGASERKDQNRSDPPIQMEESKLDSNRPQETKLADHQSPLHHSSNEVEAEEEMTVEGADARDHVGYDQRDGDDDYEPVEGEGYNLDEADEEYLDDDDDDDDFAKKLGVVSS